MSGIAAEGLSAPVTVAPANALHGLNASSSLADDAPADLGASARAAATATDHAASSAIVAGIGPLTPFPAPEARAISGEWASPAGETLVTMTGTAQELNTSVTHLNELFVLNSSVSGASTMGHWESGEVVDADGGGQAQLATHMTGAIAATVPSLPAFAEDQLNWWDSGHNLAESLTLQLAADLTNPSAKDAHGFTVL